MSTLAGRDIDRSLRAWPWKHPDGTAMQNSLAEHLKQIDGPAMLRVWRGRIQEIVTTGDYLRTLQLYPNKGVLAKAGEVFGLKNYEDYVLRRVASPDGKPLVALLQAIVPVLSA